MIAPKPRVCLVIRHAGGSWCNLLEVQWCRLARIRKNLSKTKRVYLCLCVCVFVCLCVCECIYVGVCVVCVMVTGRCGEELNFTAY